MLLVDTAILSPGRCTITGSTQGPFIDTFRDAQDLGVDERIYLCRDAVATMAVAIGYVPAEKASALEDQLAGALATIEQLQSELSDFTDLRRMVDSIATGGMVIAETPAAGTMTTVDNEPDDDDTADALEEALDELAEIDPPPDSADAIMAWVDAEGEDGELRRAIAVHVEKRTPEHRRRKTIMALVQEKTDA